VIEEKTLFYKKESEDAHSLTNINKDEYDLIALTIEEKD